MNVIALILLIGIPMGVMQIVYRLYDPDGSKTLALADKLPVLMGRKFLTQIVAPLLFIVAFGLISVLLHIPIAVFYVVCGLVIGIINGMAVTLMYFGDKLK
ncbi:hypothetical protein [Ruminococcus sp.]|uniref:hypothetical protein n=1 Tax=Ruminococcus sp. TaxID=41978 RepID=UPI0025FA7346|nr:hypothetical protein [Ruminococcus sp.]MBQ8965447.1 hypothetical protein [Ruminococcus sp.]MBR1562309.1 hypothetical protein [Ruminococcus sp.]